MTTTNHWLIINIYAAILSHSSRWQRLDSKDENVSCMFVRPQTYFDIISQSLQAEFELFHPMMTSTSTFFLKPQIPRIETAEELHECKHKELVVVYLYYLINSEKKSLTLLSVKIK